MFRASSLTPSSSHGAPGRRGAPWAGYRVTVGSASPQGEGRAGRARRGRAGRRRTGATGRAARRWPGRPPAARRSATRTDGQPGRRRPGADRDARPHTAATASTRPPMKATRTALVLDMMGRDYRGSVPVPDCPRPRPPLRRRRRRRARGPAHRGRAARPGLRRRGDRRGRRAGAALRPARRCRRSCSAGPSRSGCPGEGYGDLTDLADRVLLGGAPPPCGRTTTASRSPSPPRARGRRCPAAPPPTPGRCAPTSPSSPSGAEPVRPAGWAGAAELHTAADAAALRARLMRGHPAGGRGRRLDRRRARRPGGRAGLHRHRGRGGAHAAAPPAGRRRWAPAPRPGTPPRGSTCAATRR